jgi:hypothetical protein
MNIKAEIIEQINQFFKEELKFRKNGLIWYQKNDLCMRLFWLQKSTYTSGFYLNLGIYFISLDNEKITMPPKVYEWHFSTRLKQFNKTLKEPFPFSEDSVKVIRDVIIKDVIPIFDYFTDKQSVFNHYEEIKVKMMAQNYTSETIKAFLEN